jgi:phage antirepressor YoqD-like protein
MLQTSFEYNGSVIQFMRSVDLMINATQMAAIFNKRTSDWLQNQSTQSFLTELSKARKSVLADLVQVTKGSNNPGTWMHEDVALEFARWLSPSFAIWCNDRIKELMRHGFTATETKLNELIENPDLIISLATKLKDERAAKEQYMAVANTQRAQLIEQAPKVEYCNNVLNAASLISSTELANELGFSSAYALHKWLKGHHVIRQVNDAYALCAAYSGKGYSQYKTFPYTDSNG